MPRRARSESNRVDTNRLAAASITRGYISGVEPQTALISLGLVLPLSADPLKLTFLFIGVICFFLWGRRGFRL